MSSIILEVDETMDNKTSMIKSTCYINAFAILFHPYSDSIPGHVAWWLVQMRNKYMMYVFYLTIIQLAISTA